MIPDIDYVVILNVQPEIDGGRFPVKRVAGERLHVTADIFSHGHEVVRAVLKYQLKDEECWQETSMIHLDNDRWTGSFPLKKIGAYEYTVSAWRDPFLSWIQEVEKKHAAGVEISSELLEGRQMVQKLLSAADSNDIKRVNQILASMDRQAPPDSLLEQAATLLDEMESRSRKKQSILSQLKSMRDVLEQLATMEPRQDSPEDDPVRDAILGSELKVLLANYPDRTESGHYPRILEVIVIRPEAEFAAWYEMWPRSQGKEAGRSASFSDMEERLPEIKAMGFDVVYLPPIHPIGRTHRKGPNNSLICPPGSPGCPYAIGNEHGGHTAIDPELGTLADFQRFEKSCRDMGLEVALDLALQTSPDHPWVEEHPEWFRKRPDGTIKYAENPPKKYEDIYPLDFQTSDREGLWQAILDVIRFWISNGVRIFRVDNPHTKPVFFWEWLLAEVRRTDPDVIFLAEAFTRPKMMKTLAKAGFTQSYTYFTWRNFKQELTDYFTELTRTETAEYMRGNLFTNTPDILPRILQNAPRSAFKIRAALAATLSSVWGMYNGFELCEGTPVPGKEEYLDSEKYDYKVWDWNRPGNIKKFLTILNRIRREQTALQLYRNLHFFETDNDQILAYGKWTDDLTNIILVAVNLDPYQCHETQVRIPVGDWGILPGEGFLVHELITNEYYTWEGNRNYVRLDPEAEPVQIFRVSRWSHREQNFDYFI